jgi:hypothetical protein
MTMRTIGAIIVVVTVTLAAFVAGRWSSSLRPIDSAAFERAYEACIESAALEFRDRVKSEFRQAEREFEDKHSPYRWPVHAAIYRVFERPEAYMERVGYPASNVRHIECVRAAAVR